MTQVSQSINRLANKQRQRFSSITMPMGLTPAQAKVLHYALHRKQPVFQRDIEEEFGFRSPTASDLLKTLESNGFISREPAPDDARKKRIVITAKGTACRHDLDDAIDGLEKRLTAGIPPDELSIWLKTARKMTDNL